MACYRGGWAGGGGEWEAGGGLNLLLGPLGLAMGPRSASHRPKHAWMALADVSLSLGLIADPCLPCCTPHASQCLSHEFTWSTKLPLERQTSQPSPVMALCMCSVQV